jgi:hypothetical protein
MVRQRCTGTIFYALHLPLSLDAEALSEGVDDNDEMFWMILGDEQYAIADYWKWRKTSCVTDPKIWRLNASNESEAVSTFKSSL